MGRRFYKERYPDYRIYTENWHGHDGKYYKRRYHKAIRLAAKRELRGLHTRKSAYGAISKLNWKGY